MAYQRNFVINYMEKIRNMPGLVGLKDDQFSDKFIAIYCNGCV